MQTQSFLLIDGANMAVSLNSVEGGNLRGDVVANDVNTSNNFLKKHISNISWTPITIKTIIPPGSAIANIIKASLAETFYRFSGKIFMNYNNQAPGVIQFNNAIVTEIIFPGADLKNKDAGNFSFTFIPEQVRLTDEKLNSAQRPPDRQPVKNKQDEWLSSNFNFKISGFENLKIIKVDNIILSRKLPADQTGVFREPVKTRSLFETANLKLTLSDDNDGTLSKWSKSWFIDGNHLEVNEASATFTYLDMGNKMKLFQLQLKQIGLVTWSNIKEGISVELYFEEVSIL